MLLDLESNGDSIQGRLLLKNLCLLTSMIVLTKGRLLLNLFNLWSCGKGHMVWDHSDCQKGNQLPPLHKLLFPISRKGSFYMHHPIDRIANTMTFVTPVVVHWLDREISQWVHHVGSI